MIRSSGLFMRTQSVMSLETIAKNTSVSVLASLMIELNAEENVFSLLNPAAARLDYIEIRRVIVKELNVTHSKFDKQVKQMVASWKVQIRVKPLLSAESGFVFCTAFLRRLILLQSWVGQEEVTR
jgi:hypothetical protein